MSKIIILNFKHVKVGPPPVTEKYGYWKNPRAQVFLYVVTIPISHFIKIIFPGFMTQCSVSNQNSPVVYKCWENVFIYRIILPRTTYLNWIEEHVCQISEQVSSCNWQLYSDLSTILQHKTEIYTRKNSICSFKKISNFQIFNVSDRHTHFLSFLRAPQVNFSENYLL